MTSTKTDYLALALQDADREAFGKDPESYYKHLATAARDHMIALLHAEIEYVDNYGDDGLPPTRMGMIRAIGIISQ